MYNGHGRGRGREKGRGRGEGLHGGHGKLAAGRHLVALQAVQPVADGVEVLLRHPPAPVTAHSRAVLVQRRHGVRRLRRVGEVHPAVAVDGRACCCCRCGGGGGGVGGRGRGGHRGLEPGRGGARHGARRGALVKVRDAVGRALEARGRGVGAVRPLALEVLQLGQHPLQPLLPGLLLGVALREHPHRRLRRLLLHRLRGGVAARPGAAQRGHVAVQHLQRLLADRDVGGDGLHVADVHPLLPLDVPHLHEDAAQQVGPGAAVALGLGAYGVQGGGGGLHGGVARRHLGLRVMGAVHGRRHVHRLNLGEARSLGRGIPQRLRVDR